VRHHLDGGADSSGLPPIRAPLVVERGEARLVAHLVAEGSEALLLLEGQPTRRDPARLAALGLSPRESEVLGGVAEGRTTREIAATLGLSPRTVQTYLERVFAKLGVETRAAAVARALRSEPVA
jgi:DNA-binding CsgD family transcriptional regulator